MGKSQSHHPDPRLGTSDAASSLDVEFLEAVKAHARTRMGCFISDGGKNQFSGTFLRYRGCHFVCTASHCLHDIHDFSTLVVSTHGHQRPGISLATAKPLRAVDAGSKAPHEMIDVGVLLLPEYLVRVLDVDWFDESNTGSVPAMPDSCMALAGFPSELIQVAGGSQLIAHPSPVVGLTSLTACTPEQLSEVHPSYTPDVEFLLDYDTSMPFVGQGAATPSGMHPRGMSGCGVFAVPQFAPDQIWSPRAILAGIQSAWIEDRRPPLIRVKRIEWLLHMLNQNAGLLGLSAGSS